MMTRREFLKQSAVGAAAVWSAGCATGSGGAASGKIPIALQLYSVRKEAAKDLEGVIAAVAKMGYKGVEFAGYHNRDAKTLRKLLDDNGLKLLWVRLFSKQEGGFIPFIGIGATELQFCPFENQRCHPLRVASHFLALPGALDDERIWFGRV